MLQEGRGRGVFRLDLAPDVDAILIRHLLGGLVEQASAKPEKAADLTAAGTRTVLAAVAAHRPDR